MVVCFFKQKTAYEMRISDWSSDVCSSDLPKGAFDFEEFSSYFPITVICTLIGAPADTIPSLRSSLEAVGLSASMQREHVPALQAGFIEIDGFEIGRAHVLTPVTNAHLVCRLLLATTIFFSFLIFFFLFFFFFFFFSFSFFSFFI